MWLLSHELNSILANIETIDVRKMAKQVSLTTWDCNKDGCHVSCSL